MNPATTPTAPEVTRRTGATEQRPDIQGLRAVAIVLVIASHLSGRPSGGFVGVDVFFVISGFLITGMLVREVERDGRISFREFYARRARRILPAALLVLAVTCITARVLFFDSRARATYVDSLWSALSLGNWHLAAAGTDYFQSTLPPSAAQQYWSLSVEEQFYLAWPVLIVVVAALASRLGLRRVVLLTTTLAVVVLASFGWALHQSATATTTAYFSTATRAWELGVGGLIAFGTQQLRRQPRWLSRLLAWGGLLAILLGALTTRADATFPAPGALPAVLGAAALIAGGCAATRPRLLVLANPATVFLGQISYSLYLWHWPVIIFADTLRPAGGPLVGLTVLGSVLALAVSTFYGVEQPIRRTAWFSARAPGVPPRGLSPRARLRYTAVAASLAVIAAALMLQPPTVVPAGATLPSSVAPPGTDRTPTRTGTSDSTAAAWQRAVTAAVNAQTWPPLKPSLDDLGRARAKEWDACGNVGPEQVADCHFGPTTRPRGKTLVVLGDSVAISWLPALRVAFEPRGWAIQGLTFGECPSARIDVTSASGDKAFTSECAEHQRFALSRTAELQPSLVVLSNTEDTLNRLVGAESPEQAAGQWESALTDAVESIQHPGTRVVLLSAPPIRRDLPGCATRVGGPADCLSTISPRWQTMSGVETRVAEATGARYLDVSTLTCDRQGFCPGFVNTTPVMADGVHLTDTISRQLGPFLHPVLTRR